MSDFLNFIIGSCVFFGFVYCLFFVARAGWSREWDKWNKVVAITEVFRVFGKWGIELWEKMKILNFS